MLSWYGAIHGGAFNGGKGVFMERKFDEELKELSGMLMKMGSLAQTMIHKSIKALVDRDMAMLKDVYKLEESVN